MPIVSNAGPILSFARADKLALLRATVAELLIPDAVAEEIGNELLREVPWLKRQTVRDAMLVATLPEKLHLGEREAIVLAEERNGVLLIDEREARREARRRRVEHFGSLSVLKRAKEKGLLVRVRPVLDKLLASGTYISQALYKEFLRQVEQD